jgi:copper chaperone CopZ
MTTADEKVKETIEITNMTCVGCARTIENALRKFDGIEYSVSFADKSFTVTFPSANYSRIDFEKAVEAHGYRVKGNEY